ncbi:type I-E CRISPR-associated protein Cse1/CasA [Glycomyces artemisiae]|uniref:CRISPR-associated Cse1 family protein n=1 Tax=Glycomyces artemisiae TaxID=1076443 RepID=A0A2T0UER3_9ACTN|nr:type I-E CRISPR-associated protein Cse1/CasA [Glycomyces artemisiae]PRY56419.1 CRISPR-associated Cse1 family protein [Glycomyces artemisiae]
MRFNLLEQPWLPLLDHDGRTREATLLDALTGAHRYRAIAGDAPTQNLALLRLLLAVADAATGTLEWERMWRSRALDAGAIGAYLEARRDRFDLLHPDAPFYGTIGLTTSRGVRLPAAVIADAAPGRHYSMREAAGLARVGLAEAARWLVHVHAYDIAGIKPGAEGDPRIVRGKVFGIGTGPCGAFAGIHLEGATLAETILLNLAPDGARGRGGDLPAWDRAPATAAPRDTETPTGLADLYTWQSRRVCLTWDEDSVTGAVLCQGDPYAPESDPEPMAHRRWDSAGKRWRRRRFDAARPVWRDLADVLAADGQTALAPPVIDWARDRALLLDGDLTLRVTGTAYGTQAAVVTDAGSDAVPLPARLLTDEAARDGLAAAAAVLRGTEHALTRYVRTLDTAAGSRETGAGPDRIALAARGPLDAAMRAWLWEEATLDELHDEARTVARDLVDAEPVSAAAWRGRQIEGRWVTAGTAARQFQADLAVLDRATA